MSIIAITGNHSRHIYMVKQIERTGFLSGWVVEQREAATPIPDDNLSNDLKKIFKLHFDRRDRAERDFFGSDLTIHDVNVDHITISRGSINDQTSVEFIRNKGPDVIISYGCGIISSETRSYARKYCWNIHGGLSPWYRGAITHFWPSYLLEPQMTGVTLHATTDQIDGGPIFHQTGVELVSGDGLHQLACRSIKTFADKLPTTLQRALNFDGLIHGVKQKSSGRIWTKSMWHPEHLVVIYCQFNDRIVDFCIENNLEIKKPKLITIEDAIEKN